MKKLQLIVLAFLLSCTNPPYRGEDVLGADEFVLDSYKIRDGKFSILELEGKPLELLKPSLLDEYKDTLQDEDVLNIAIYHPSRRDIVAAVAQIGATIGYRIENGKVQLPDLQPVEIQGLTLEEAREKLEKEYQKEISNVEVFMSYKARRARKVELAGLVSMPDIPVNGRIRLFEILANARVPTNANYFKSYVVREEKMVPVDMYRLMAEGDMSQNIVMRGGDKVYIADQGASSCMVMGEVRREGIIALPSGKMPLRHALAEAGGIPESGDRSYIQIIRGNIAKPKIYTLNWKHVVRLPTDALLIMPGDIVYVAATPIAEWNRFVNSMLPTVTAYELFNKHIKGVILP